MERGMERGMERDMERPYVTCVYPTQPRFLSIRRARIFLWPEPLNEKFALRTSIGTFCCHLSFLLILAIPYIHTSYIHTCINITSTYLSFVFTHLLCTY